MIFRRTQSLVSDAFQAAAPIPLARCLAKTRRAHDGKIIPGQSVLSHCLIVGEVAKALVSRMPPWLADDLFPPGTELIAASHDIGKVSPTFQKKIYHALSAADSQVINSLKPFPAKAENKLWGGHAGVSQASLVALKAGNFIPEIVGQHHGYSPNLSIYTATSEVFGGDQWQRQREELFNKLSSYLGRTLPIISHERQALAIAGLVSVADWIGSGAMFEDPDYCWRDKINEALDRAGFVSPSYKKGLSFDDIFGFSPRPVQTALSDSIKGSGVYILEAPMGMGKTEAALWAAYNVLAKQQATGIYFALPTQLTSDKVYERMNQFLRKILQDDSNLKSALLLHSAAHLRDTEMGEDGAPGGSWFSQGKRGILAPFAVGTIDQALMAALNVKHGFVRAFGLAGKVVILDEVHSYDLFTGTLIDSLLEILSHLKCTVIILSATLTRERRASLTASTIASLEYPLITAKQGTGDVLEVGINNSTDSSIDVKITDEAASIEEAISRAEHGQQVLWIENTVDDAQRIYRVLSARATDLRISCGLLHSRFTKASRAKHEDLWVALYGKDGHGHRLGSGRILVGTQVLEQSLDIDSDFLVSRIAPADMLLQRMGRLWRHEQTPRPSSARREAWIIAPKLERALVNPIREFGSTGLVYAPYVLCRTLEVWQGIDILSIPSQIRSILEKTYTKRPENERMAYLLSQLEEKGNKLRQLALRGLARGGTTQPDESAQTRYSEIDSTEVILLRYLHLSPDKKWMRVGLLDGTEYSIPIAGKGLKKAQVREIISCLGEHTARVASHLAPSKMHYSEAQWLKDYLYLGNPDFEEGVPFRIGIVDDSGMVRLNNNGNGNLKYRISYSETLGYQAEKIAADIYTDGETD